MGYRFLGLSGNGKERKGQHPIEIGTVEREMKGHKF